MFQPVQVAGSGAQLGPWPTAVCTMWGPAGRVMPLASGPQGSSCISPPPRACWVEPTTATSIGLPSMVRRFDTQVPGTVAGVGADCTPGMPISAMAMGSASGPAE
jgi:hypothetical protein